VLAEADRVAREQAEAAQRALDDAARQAEEAAKNTGSAIGNAFKKMKFW
jgi:hypothetical protein